jgi:hypothetical protein
MTMAKKSSYGYETDPPVDDPVSETTTKSETTAQHARDWWNTILNTTTIVGQNVYRVKFKNPNAPTDDELIAAYDEAHQPATADVAKAWWDGLTATEKASVKAAHDSMPAEEDIIAMYDEAHARDGVVELPPDSTIPRVQPATPGASATNPELMPNDAVPVTEVPLYAGMPRRPPEALPGRDQAPAPR